MTALSSSARSTGFVIAVASLLVGGALGAQLIPRRGEAPPPRVIEHPPEATFAEPPSRSITGLEQCDAYIDAIEQYLLCPAVPQAARDGARQGLQALRDGWGDLHTIPDDVRAQTNDACRQAVDALRQGAAAMDCAIRHDLAPSCRAYVDRALQIDACDRLPRAALDALLEGARTLVASGDESTCAYAAQGLEETARTAGCTLP